MSLVVTAESAALVTVNPATRVFYGFTTQGGIGAPARSLYDIDLVNLDLYYAFQTRRGERVGRPNYGCLIWQWLMEPITPGLFDQIIAEVARIAGLDSRLVLKNVQPYEFQHGIRVEVTSLYLPWQVTGTFTTDFTQRQQDPTLAV